MQRRKISQVGQEAVERLDLPPEVAAGVPQVELYGDRQLYMAGHRGVIAYSTEEVAVSGGSLTVRIKGENLQLAAMTDSELRLTARCGGCRCGGQGREERQGQEDRRAEVQGEEEREDPHRSPSALHQGRDHQDRPVIAL